MKLFSIQDNIIAQGAVDKFYIPVRIHVMHLFAREKKP